MHPAPTRARALTVIRSSAVLAALALVAGSVLAAVPAQADGRRIAVPAAKPSWATAAADSGAVSAATTIELELALTLPDEAGARAFALAAATPGTPAYRRYLAPTDWIARFSPTQATVDSVTTAVANAGLTVESVPASRLFLLLKGSAAQVDAFLATRVHTYDVDGDTRLAAAGTATLPQPVARSVAAITFTHARIQAGPTVTKKKSTISPCSQYWRQHTVQLAKKAYGMRSTSTPLCGYSAAQLRTLAGVQRSKLDGSGQTIAVIDAFAAPSMRRDLATYSARNHLPASAYSELLPATIDESSGCDAADWQPEQALDLEAAHAVAPRAKLLYVGASDCGTGFDVATSRVLDGALASIISNSWGATALDTLAGSSDDATRQSMVVMLHQQLQAAGQGVGLYFASGDYGDERELLGSTAVDFPASSPFVTAVGGVAAGLNRSGSRAFTSPWGESVALLSGSKKQAWSPKLPGDFLGGAGGGASSLFTAPAYQSGVVPGSLAHGMRASTDVSALAATTTGFLVGYRPSGPSGVYRTVAVGGTSLATPIVAAQVALAQQATGRRLGFLNPALYAVAEASPSAFRDVVPSSTRRAVALRSGKRTVLVTVDRDGTLTARKGYDLPTGLGELTTTAFTALGRL